MGFVSDILGKSQPSAPVVPDYTGAAQAQGAANLETAKAQNYMTNPNVYGPLGSQTVTFGANDQPTVTQTLTPAAQATLESQQRVQRSLAGLGEQGIGTASQVLRQGFNPNLSGIQTGIGNAGQISQTPDLSGYGQAGGLSATGQNPQAPELSAYGMAGAGPSAGQYGFAQGGLNTSNVASMPVNAGMTGQQAIMARLAPQLARMDDQTRQRLANQGLVAGGEAYGNAMIDVNQQKNDLLSQAALQGLNLDMSANNQGYNQALQGAQFGNTAQQQALAQQMQLRNQPLNEIIGLMGGSQIQMPQFQGYQGANVAPAPVFAGAQAQGNAAMNQYGQDMNAYNTNIAGLYNLAGAGAKAMGK